MLLTVVRISVPNFKIILSFWTELSPFKMHCNENAVGVLFTQRCR